MTPSARIPRPRRLRVDPRLVIGLALVLAAVAGVVGVVSAADTTVAVLAAKDPLAVGERITSEDLVERRVSLDGAERLYLAAAALPAGGAVLLRSIDDGELVPLSALGDPEGESATTLVVPLSAPPSAAIRSGAEVEIWGADSASPGAGEEPPPPAVLASGATVVEVIADDGVLSSAEETSVELRVPRARVARILQALADGEAIALVPSGLPIGELP